MKKSVAVAKQTQAFVSLEEKVDLILKLLDPTGKKVAKLLNIEEPEPEDQGEPEE